MASAMQPVLMSPVVIEGASYVDGGVRKTVAIKVAMDNGATDVYAVVLTAENEAADAGPFTDLAAILKRTIDLFGQEIVLGEIRRAQLSPASLHVIRPANKLLADSLKFSTADMRRMVRQGRERVDELWPALAPNAPPP